ncbi:uncharacterized protein si:dkey-121a11.3 isoform X2 [Anabas testudineus]|uniref:uncharacterized protein si:dkey-121a11.3 isoform X2 n=1 Tax=Anabas testudineus TaxID=64144 RepID=UPI000E460D07|nr:uncharacterized protein si:dkey-121a11.3 isoform X2 [Anabas testudineus]
MLCLMYLENAWTSITPADKVRNFLSLGQRTQLNCTILQHLLNSQRALLDNSQLDTVSQSLSPRRQQQREGRARMKRRRFPVRGDHDLMTPDTCTLSGNQLCPVTQVRLLGMTSHSANLGQSANLGESSNNKAAAGQMTRRPAASPSRRLRFEDETEMEVESRYQERQRRRGWIRGTGVLVSKPGLNVYISDRAGQGLQVIGQCHTCGTSSEGPVDFSQHTPVSDDRRRCLYKTNLNLWTEPIRETYIGSAIPSETRGRGALSASNMQQAMVTCPPTAPPPMTSLMTSTAVRLNGRKAGQDLNQDLLGGPAAAQLTERSPRVDLRRKNSACLLAQVEPLMTSSESPAQSQDPPTSESTSDGQVKQPMNAELHSADAPIPEQFCSRDESSHLSLRRLFSNIRLSRTRTGSLDQLKLNPHPPASDHGLPGTRMTSSLLKKSSVQSLSVGAPFSQLRKSSSVQSFGSEQKKKNDCSADYRPESDRFLPQTLSVEDIGHPGSTRSIGRVLQVCCDGTVQLELSRPPGGMFGFIISQGSAHSTSGVYVEDMLDYSTEKLYSGLLSVGDEILEVNGEKVAGLSLDQVTLLLSQNPSTMVCVIRHRRPSPLL